MDTWKGRRDFKTNTQNILKNSNDEEHIELNGMQWELSFLVKIVHETCQIYHALTFHVVSILTPPFRGLSHPCHMRWFDSLNTKSRVNQFKILGNATGHHWNV
jgi:hypothetical protein